MTQDASSRPLTGAFVAVTGGGRGIGKAIAKTLLDVGASVVIGDVDIEAAVWAANELGARRDSARIAALPLDVADRASFAAFLDDAEDRYGPLDALVNNAGIAPTGMLLDEADDMIDRVIDTNLKGVIIGSKLAGARFARRGSGSIINMASLAGVSAYPGLATYCATKHGVVGFSDAFNRELGDQGVSVTAVLPGLVPTELSAGANVPKWVRAASTVQPGKVADAVVAVLLSDRPEPRIAVPARLGAILKLVSITPDLVRTRLEHFMGVDTIYAQPEPTARESYRRRITDGA